MVAKEICQTRVALGKTATGEHWYECPAYGWVYDDKYTRLEQDLMVEQACECSLGIALKGLRSPSCGDRAAVIKNLVENYCHSDECKSGDLIEDMLEDEDRIEACICYAKHLIAAYKEVCGCSTATPVGPT